MATRAPTGLWNLSRPRALNVHLCRSQPIHCVPPARLKNHTSRCWRWRGSIVLPRGLIAEKLTFETNSVEEKLSFWSWLHSFSPSWWLIHRKISPHSVVASNLLLNNNKEHYQKQITMNTRCLLNYRNHCGFFSVSFSLVSNTNPWRSFHDTVWHVAEIWRYTRLECHTKFLSVFHRPCIKNIFWFYHAWHARLHQRLSRVSVIAK